MRSVTRSLVTFGKGLGIWIILIFLNTRDGEADTNSIKIVLDVIIAIMLVGNSRRGRQIAICAAVFSAILTFLRLPEVVEILFLIGTAVLGGMILRYFPETEEYQQTDSDMVFGHNVRRPQQVTGWKAHNVLCPFERYTYSPDEGIRIFRGLLRTSYIEIPTNNVRIKIDQSLMQHILGICEISFLSNFTGQRFGEETMKNIKYKSARELSQMLSGVM